MMEPGENNQATAGTHLARASWFMDRDRNQEALNELYRAVEADPFQALASAMASVCLYRMGRYEALEWAWDALELDPQMAYAHYALALCMWGLVDRQSRALSAIDTAIAQDPGSAAFVAQKAIFLRIRGEWDRALERINHAVALAPESAIFRVQKSEILICLRLHQEALAAAYEAVRLGPENASAHAALGKALMTLGRHEEAVAAYREALRLDPNSMSRPIQLQLLDALRHRSWLHPLAQWVEDRSEFVSRKWEKVGNRELQIDGAKVMKFLIWTGVVAAMMLAPCVIPGVLAKVQNGIVIGVMTALAGAMGLLVALLLWFLSLAILKQMVVFTLLRDPEARVFIPQEIAASAVGLAAYVASLPAVAGVLWFAVQSPLDTIKIASAFFMMAMLGLFFALMVGKGDTKVVKLFGGAMAVTCVLLGVAVAVQGASGEWVAVNKVLTSPVFILAPVILVYFGAALLEVWREQTTPVPKVVKRKMTYFEAIAMVNKREKQDARRGTADE